MDNWKFKISFLKQIAKAKGYTQEFIAKELGMSQQTIARFYSCKHSPKMSTFDKISECIGVVWISKVEA